MCLLKKDTLRTILQGLFYDASIKYLWSLRLVTLMFFGWEYQNPHQCVIRLNLEKHHTSKHPLNNSIFWMMSNSCQMTTPGHEEKFVCNIVLRLSVFSFCNNSVTLLCILHIEHMYEYILPLLTVALITCIYLSFQSFCFCKLGQHFCQQTWVLRRHLLAVAVIPLRKLQGEVPERFYGI